LVRLGGRFLVLSGWQLSGQQLEAGLHGLLYGKNEKLNRQQKRLFLAVLFPAICGFSQNAISNYAVQAVPLLLCLSPVI